MYKVFILNSAKDSKGVSKYKINPLFIRYFTIKFIFIQRICDSDTIFFIDFLKLI